MAKVREDYSQRQQFQLDPMTVDVGRPHYQLDPMVFQEAQKQSFELPPMAVQQPMNIEQLLAMQRAKQAEKAQTEQRLQGGLKYTDEGLLPGPGMVPWAKIKDIWPWPIPEGKQPVALAVSPQDLRMLREMGPREAMPFEGVVDE